MPPVIPAERLATRGPAASTRRRALDQSQVGRGRADHAVADKNSLNSPAVSPCSERRAFSFHDAYNGNHDQDYWDGDGGEKQTRKRSPKLEL